MPDKKLTPMMELIEWINSKNQLFTPTKSSLLEKAKELQEKERQMVIDSINDISDEQTPEQYYTQTYKS